jgi:hypothetical protein
MPYRFEPSLARHLNHWPALAAISTALTLRGSLLLIVIVIAPLPHTLLTHTMAYYLTLSNIIVH